MFEELTIYEYGTQFGQCKEIETHGKLNLALSTLNRYELYTVDLEPAPILFVYSSDAMPMATYVNAVSWIIASDIYLDATAEHCATYLVMSSVPTPGKKYHNVSHTLRIYNGIMYYDVAAAIHISQ